MKTANEILQAITTKGQKSEKIDLMIKLTREDAGNYRFQFHSLTKLSTFQLCL